MSKRRKNFTPLEKVYPVRKNSSSGVKERNSLTGFTLIELVVVIIVISTLASLGLLPYRKAVERAKNKEAKNSPGLISAAERITHYETGRYKTCSSITDCND